MKALVVGIGNELRGDDDAGLAVARMLRRGTPSGVTIVELNNDVISLIDHLPGNDIAIIVDATQSDSPAGTIHRFDTSTLPLPEAQSRRSTHGMTVGSILELARLQKQLPKKVLVFGIEGTHFSHGSSLTPEVKSAVEKAVGIIQAELGFEWSSPAMLSPDA